MAFTALYNDEERGAWSVPKGEAAYCTDCGDAMHVVSESVDGRARHFRHNPDHSGGGGGGGGCSGGESDEHRKWKNFAAERLHELFSDRAADRATVEEPLAAPISDKQDRAADACVFFENHDRQFGRGLAIEVQHKNKDKDKLAVERDYDRQGVATLWLTGDDFHDDGLRLTELDIRHRVREQTSICELCPKWSYVVRSSKYGDLTTVDQPTTHEKSVYEAYDPRERNVSVDATIVADWVLPTPREYWKKQGWEAGFSVNVGSYGHQAFRKRDVEVTAAFPRHWYEQTPADYWRSEPWEDRFRSPDGYYKHRQHTVSGLVSTLPNRQKTISATLLRHWCVPTRAEYWRSTPWHERFHTVNGEYYNTPPRGQHTRIEVLIPPLLSADDLEQKHGKYTCRDCAWKGDEYLLWSGTAVCPNCRGGLLLSSAVDAGAHG